MVDTICGVEYAVTGSMVGARISLNIGKRDL